MWSQFLCDNQRYRGGQSKDLQENCLRWDTKIRMELRQFIDDVFNWTLL